MDSPAWEVPLRVIGVLERGRPYEIAVGAPRTVIVKSAEDIPPAQA